MILMKVLTSSITMTTKTTVTASGTSRRIDVGLKSTTNNLKNSDTTPGMVLVGLRVRGKRFRKISLWRLSRLALCLRGGQRFPLEGPLSREVEELGNEGIMQ
jgi:hypothetical protein